MPALRIFYLLGIWCLVGSEAGLAVSNPETFTCSDGQLILQAQVCDAVVDCDNDEADCEGQFLCNNGVIIDESRHCDGNVNCMDGEDEDDCPEVTLCNPNPCLHDGTCYVISETLSLCYCQTFWTGFNCEIDVNECSQESTCSPGTCTNEEGYFVCDCPEGYRVEPPEAGVGIAQSCEDINECETGDHDCGENSNCVNNIGSWDCQCNDGYQKAEDGITCIPTPLPPFDPCDVTIQGSEHQRCSFPFEHDGVSWRTCVPGNNSPPWCVVNEEDNSWGYCEYIVEQVADRSMQKCVFPFEYNNKIYFDCTTEGGTSGKLWCATTTTLGTTSNQWGYCPTEECDVTTPSTLTTAKYAKEVTTESYDDLTTFGASTETYDDLTTYVASTETYDDLTTYVASTESYDDLTTYGASTESYDDLTTYVASTETYDDLTTFAASTETYDDLTTFGASTESYDEDSTTEESFLTPPPAVDGDSSSTNCYTPTLPDGIGTSEDNCHFPFIYRGKVYTECTTVYNFGVLWCATEFNYDVNRLWGNCGDEICDDDNEIEAVEVEGFSVIFNQHALGGVEVEDGETIPDCKLDCLRDPECIAFDYDTYFRKCFKHTRNYDLAPATGVHHYVKTNTSSECDNSFIKFERTLAYFGVEMAIDGVATEESCSEACRDTPDCRAFDLDHVQGTCYMHVEGFEDNVISDVDGVTHFRRQPCNEAREREECDNSFVKFERTLAYFGVEMTIDGEATEESCSEACRDIPDCRAFDLDHVQGTCYMHVKGFENNVISDVDDVTHFRRQPCNVSVERKECDDTFVKFERTNAYYGSEMTIYGDVTEESCSEACRNSLVCQAFDLDHNQGTCYMHVEGFEEYVVSDVDGVTQYRRQPCNESDEVSECTDEYIMFPGRLSHGGQGQDSVNNVSDCAAVCNADLQCAGYDFDVSLSECFIHTPSSVHIYQNYVPEVMQYILIHRCGLECNDLENFDEFTGYTWEGGLLQESAMSSSECAAICRSLPHESCAAFVFKRNSGLCYIHRQEDEENVTQGEGMSVFLRRCYDES